MALYEGIAKESVDTTLNWQLMILIYFGICWALVFIVTGLFLPWLIVILNIVFCLVAAIRSSKGEQYKYPLLSFKFGKRPILPPVQALHKRPFLAFFEEIKDGVIDRVGQPYREVAT